MIFTQCLQKMFATIKVFLIVAVLIGIHVYLLSFPPKKRKKILIDCFWVLKCNYKFYGYILCPQLLIRHSCTHTITLLYLLYSYPLKNSYLCLYNIFLQLYLLKCISSWVSMSTYNLQLCLTVKNKKKKTKSYKKKNLLAIKKLEAVFYLGVRNSCHSIVFPVFCDLPPPPPFLNTQLKAGDFVLLLWSFLYLIF